jgi:hypothetical protein
MIDRVLRVFQSRIEAMITNRIVTFYKHLVEHGAIRALPNNGPPAS